MSQKNTATSTSKFQLDGRPSMKEAVPLGLQHVLAMFVGNIVPMILVASVANLSVQDANMLLQCCMLGAAISTAIQLYPIRIGSIQIGSGLPCMMGLTYVFLPACLSIAGSKGIPYIFGAQIAAGVIAISYGTLLKKMSSFFPPVVTGTIVMTVGVSIILPSAILRAVHHHLISVPPSTGQWAYSWCWSYWDSMCSAKAFPRLQPSLSV